MKINDSVAIIVLLFIVLFGGYCYIQYKASQLSDEVVFVNNDQRYS